MKIDAEKTDAEKAREDLTALQWLQRFNKVNSTQSLKVLDELPDYAKMLKNLCISLPLKYKDPDEIKTIVPMFQNFPNFSSSHLEGESWGMQLDREGREGREERRERNRENSHDF